MGTEGAPLGRGFHARPPGDTGGHELAQEGVRGTEDRLSPNAQPKGRLCPVFRSQTLTHRHTETSNRTPAQIHSCRRAFVHSHRRTHRNTDPTATRTPPTSESRCAWPRLPLRFRSDGFPLGPGFLDHRHLHVSSCLPSWTCSFSRLLFVLPDAEAEEGANRD